MTMALRCVAIAQGSIGRADARTPHNLVDVPVGLADGLGIEGSAPVGGYVDLQVQGPAAKGNAGSFEQALRFAWWAHQLHKFPNVQQVIEHFDVCRATAYRWRNALAAAHGIECPRDDSPDGTMGEVPRD
ncbi:hypothetical protein LVB77_14700 [Lysobacter sp. 5GHs7-4]|uniref:hypothetical protein n=1 Tax=Lysobacter sp. 5GHs7-4 TaxID=2904253 RepID=UPI001E2FC7DC|nr:hypothetical protein [Lysobacter sp. 5GHs7-4]UHQ21915.1 hypothetical protein LVB77_14700 [Lysobacter sp. 5GHs7-4]